GGKIECAGRIFGKDMAHIGGAIGRRPADDPLSLDLWKDIGEALHPTALVQLELRPESRMRGRDLPDGGEERFRVELTGEAPYSLHRLGHRRILFEHV